MIKCPCGASFKSHASMGGHSRQCDLCTPDVRFWLKVEKGEGCWNWTGALQRDGYAHVNMNGKTITSHRYAYEQLVGPIPAGMDLLHSCDNRKCVNPSHLRPGTHEENMAECKAKGRSTVGEKNKSAVVTPEQVRLIRSLHRVGRHKRDTNTDELMAKFGVSRAVIVNIVSRRTWKHL